MPANKLHNEYAARFGSVYAETPKAVFAAIAYSMCFMVSEEDSRRALARFAEEWQCLHDNGIVPQKPLKGIADA
jgi:hypothetical protein